MLIKEMDGREGDITELNALLAMPHIGAETKRKIQAEILKIQSGLKGEKDAAHQINFHYEQSKNWAVIHDLRLELDGNTAQIDHLLINRFLEVYVCESKRFQEGIGINEHGEFYCYVQGRPRAIPSPIEQNNRHKFLLKRLFSSSEIELPTRLGLKMRPSLHSLILIANTSSIRRPKNGKNVENLDRIIKVEQLYKRINKDIDDNSPGAILHTLTATAKIISSATLKRFAENLANLHAPIQTDWKARFGIVEPSAVQPLPAQTESHQLQTNRLFCSACKKTVTPNVASFCWNHKTRFHGKVYCYDCQLNVK